MKKILALGLVLVMALAMLAGCSSNQTPTTTVPKDTTPAASNGDTQGTEPAADALPLAGKKFAYILNVVSSDIFQMAANSAKETAEALGATVDVYFTDTDNTKFQDTVAACSNQGYDGMFLSHGNQESALALVTDLRNKGIEVVCFDTQFVDDSGANVNGSVENVTQMFQNDQDMAKMLLDYLLSLYPEKVKAGAAPASLPSIVVRKATRSTRTRASSRPWKSSPPPTPRTANPVCPTLCPLPFPSTPWAPLTACGAATTLTAEAPTSP